MRTLLVSFLALTIAACSGDIDAPSCDCGTPPAVIRNTEVSDATVSCSAGVCSVETVTGATCWTAGGGIVACCPTGCTCTDVDGSVTTACP